MKLLCLFLLLLPLHFALPEVGDPIDKTAELIKTGDIHELAKSFSSSVELSVMGQEDVYPGARAEAILTDFFKQNQPRSANILHRITSNPNYRFAVLILSTNNGVFRVSFSLKNNRGRFELTEFRIEAEKAK